MKLSLAFSPCPNDTFIFDALVNNKIDTEGIEFDVMLEDVQTLNERAVSGKTDVSKVSYGVLPLVLDKYQVLNSGGALGMGVGPLLVSNNLVDQMEQVDEMRIAIPGINTTAHLLFSFAFPSATHKSFFVFNQIEDAVLTRKVDAGVIIHENRFTYHEKGLLKIVDLGEYWERQTGLPIPLGGIVIKKELGLSVQQTVDRLIRKSVAYALENYPTITGYTRQNAQEMDESVMLRHIDLYVNSFSLSLGAEGKKAVEKLMQVYNQLNSIAVISSENYFVAETDT